MSESTTSISTCLELLKQGQEAAAALLYQRFFRRLAGLARSRLTTLPRQAAADHEDVARSAFNDFCLAVRANTYADLQNRQDLWSVLACFVTNKARTLIDRERAQKRGGGAVRGESVFEPAERLSGEGRGLDGFASPEADPTVIAEFEELMDRFRARLDEKQLVIAGLMLEGQSSEAIAEEVGISPAGARRKMKVLRGILAEVFGFAVAE